MKKFFLISLTFIFIMSFFLGCLSKSPSKKNIDTQKNEAITETINNTIFIVDPRIEFMSIIMYLSPTYSDKYKTITPYDLSYKNDVEDWFGKYRDHDAVKLFDFLFQPERGYSKGLPLMAMLYLTNTPSLKIREDINKTDYISSMEEKLGENQFENFINALNDFCIKSNFHDFFNNHKDYYENILDSAISGLKDTDYPSNVESYFGTKQKSYNVILSPLVYGITSYGKQIENKGRYDAYAILSCAGVNNDLPYYPENTYKSTIRHEFSHSFINPLIYGNTEEIDKYKALFNTMSNAMKSMPAYGTWTVALDEHLVRAAVIRISSIYDNLNTEDETNLVKNEQRYGFIYMDKFVDLLKNEYEPNRDKYPTFEDFYPEILKLLNDILYSQKSN